MNYIYICQRHCEKCYKWRILSVDISVWDWSTGKPPVLYNTDDSLPSDAAAWLTKPIWSPLAADLKIVGTGTTHLMLLSWILSLFVPARRTQSCWHWLLRLYVPTRRLLTWTFNSKAQVRFSGINASVTNNINAEYFFQLENWNQMSAFDIILHICHHYHKQLLCELLYSLILITSEVQSQDLFCCEDENTALTHIINISLTEIDL